MTRDTHIAPSHGLRRVRQRLRVIRRAGRTLLLVRECSRFLIVALVLTVGLIAADHAARLPTSARWMVFAVLVLGAAMAVRRRLVPIGQFRPPLVDVAHRVEAWLASRGGERSTRLMSGVGLRTPGGERDDTPRSSAGAQTGKHTVDQTVDRTAEQSGDPLTASLVAIAESEVAGLLPTVPWGVLRWKRPASFLAVLVLLACLGAAVVNAYPAFALTGLTRLYAPWVDASWPKLTNLVDDTPQVIHPADAALPLRVILTKSNRPAGEAAISVRYRIVDVSGDKSPEARAVLVPQPGAGREGASTPGRTGELYERIIEPGVWTKGGREGTRTQDAQERWLEYRFTSEDDETRPRRVRIVDPPVLRSATVDITPPAYADLSTSSNNDRAAWTAGETIPAPSGSVVGPILSGSRVSLRLEYSKPITPSDLTENDDGDEDRAVTVDGTAATIRLRAMESTAVSLGAVDEDGLRVRDPYRVRLAAIRDRPPTALVIEPSSDRAVLATALLPLAGEAADDLGLSEVRMEYRVARPAAGSESTEVEPADAPERLASITASQQTEARLESVLDLERVAPKPGEEIWVEVIATDIFELDGVRHDEVRSAVRRIRIIEESQLIEILRSELEGIRRSAITLDRRQAAIMQDAAKARDAEAGEEEIDDSESAEPQRPDEAVLDDLAARQAEIGQRLRAQAASFDGIRERLEENRLRDEAIGQLIDAAREAAMRATSEAQAAAGQAAERAAGNPDADPAKAQQEVRDALAEMIDRLDRGQDDWVVRRAIEQLAEAQRELREQTAAIGEQTLGRSTDELTPDERTELERIAARQQELAQRAEDAIDDLAQRAEEIRERDPTGAAALDEAARTAQNRRLAEAMREAGAQVGQNQTADAGRAQEQTIEDLEAMLEGLENAKRLRDQALRRELASLVQSIESLIRQQSAVIAAIETDPEDASPRAERVRANTLAASASARTGFEEMAGVADLLDRAGESQLVSITALRRRPPSAEEAANSAAAALARLTEALAEAKRQDEDAAQRERARIKAELLKAYRDALVTQSELLTRTAVFDPANLTRRDRAEIRGIGREQEALRVLVSGIPAQYDLPPDGIVSLYHDQIDAALANAIRKLGRGDAGMEVLNEQDAARTLMRLIVQVLSPENKPDDAFEDQESGGGGGGGQGGGGEDPPLIGQLEELRLLRSLQSVVLDRTRNAGEAPDASLAEVQRKIAEQARRVIESMQEQGPNPQPVPAPDLESDVAPSDEDGENSRGTGEGAGQPTGGPIEVPVERPIERSDG